MLFMNKIMGRGDREAVTAFCLFELPFSFVSSLAFHYL